MLRVHSFTFNPFQENTYIISNDKNLCWIIDPGMMGAEEEQSLVQFIDQERLVPQAILNTHAHIDHILGVDYIAKRYNIPFFLHEKEMPILNNAGNTAKMFGFDYAGISTQAQFISEKETLTLGSDRIEVRFTPGHSPGSISFYYPEGKWVISGDVLFAGSIGRTDLLMGNYDTLIQSIKTQLLSLPDDTLVHSGHGPVTNILTEKSSNPFLH